MSDQPESPSGAHRFDIGRVLARNTVWNYLGFVINVGTNLLLFPYVVHRLGEASAGIWLLLGSITGYMGLLELGIVPALTQRIASALGKGDRHAVNGAASTSVAMMLLMMVIGLQAAWLSPLLVGILQIPPELVREAHLAFGISIAGMALRMPLAPFQAALLGCQRQDRCNQLWIALGLFKAIATIVLIEMGFGVVAIVSMEAAAHLLAGVLQTHWVRKELPELRISWQWVQRDEARLLVGFGLTVTFAGVFVLIVEQTDRIVIGAFLPIDQVTRFSAAWKIFMLAYAVPTTLLQAMAPLVANLHGGGEAERLRVVFLRLGKYAAGVALPLTFGLGLSSGWLLRIWMGPEFESVYPVVQILLVSFAVTAYNHAGYQALMGMRRLSDQLWGYNAPLAALNLGVSLWLVKPLGIAGVALGTTIPAIIMEYPYLRLLLRCLGLSWGVFLREVVRPSALPAIVSFIPLGIVYWFTGPFSLALPVTATLCGLVNMLWFWTWSLQPHERSAFLSRVPWLSRAVPNAESLPLTRA